jgi:hypothetical protein
MILLRINVHLGLFDKGLQYFKPGMVNFCKFLICTIF